ncbi:ribonuclease H-like domain-containing protein [Tanacetum coccineum]
MWRNKPEIDTLSLDDLYSNLKIYEPEVKGTSSSSTNTQNVASVSSNSTISTNRAVNTAHGATTASTQATVVNSITIDNLSDVVINFMPPKPDLSFSGLEEFVNEPIVSEPTVKKPVVETSEAKASADKPKTVKKNNGAPIIGNPQQDLEEKGVIDSECSRHMTRNMSYLTDFEEINGGYVAFGGNPKGGKITGRVPRKNNMYSVDLKNIVPKGGLTCLFAKSTSDESKLWHRRRGHINFKTMNKLVKGNLVRDDYSRFSWVFFLATKDETSGILKSFITGVENLIDQRVKREFSVAGTPQQNGVAERKNRTLIEAAKTMLADSMLPTTFWAEAVNTACYAQNRVLVTKPHNKTPYKLFLGRKPALGFMRPFGYLFTILNTIDHLGMFDGKAMAMPQ